MWWKKNRGRVVLPLVIAAVLAAAFWYGGSAPSMQGWPEQPGGAAAPAEPPEESAVSAALSGGEAEERDAPEEPEGLIAESASGGDGEPAGPEAPPEEETLPEEPEAAGDRGQEPGPAEGTDRYGTGPVPEGKPDPVEPQEAGISDTAFTCTLSVRCDTILDHLDWLDPEKLDLVPEDGVIFPAAEVTFYEGESVFNVLQREMKKAGIHMEFENTPLYNSAYIEGIHNLYEFDCGEQSGWMYRVNGWFPNYGCSRYRLQAGDVVEWVYTCDRGADVGGSNAAGQ